MSLAQAVVNAAGKKYRHWKKHRRTFADRISLAARDGSDTGRHWYLLARRGLQLPTFLTRRSVAATMAPSPGLEIPRDGGFRIFPPGRFPEARDVVADAQAAADGVDPRTLTATKPFMLGLLGDKPLERDSSYLRLALRPDIIAAVSNYLGVVPILTHVNVYYSASMASEYSSSQLLHCDCDDVSQVKVFVLCSEVTPENGPLVIMGADTSTALRRRVHYEYRNRVTDEEAAFLGDRDRHAVVGASGTVCFVDTSRCFHFGSRVQQGATRRLVVMIQYLSPFSFMISRDRERSAPYRGAIRPGASEIERLVLGGN